MSIKLKLAWFTPNQNQTDSLSYVFSEQILGELRAKADITIFTDNFKQYQDFKTFHYLRAAENWQEYDLFVYQVENHPACDFMRFHLGQLPGMVIFHHLNFLSLGPDPLLNSPYNKIQSMMREGSWPARSEKFKRKPPLPKREAAFSLLPVFTNPQYVTDFNNHNLESLSKDYDISAGYLPFPMTFNSKKNVRDGILTLATPAKVGTSERITKILRALSFLPHAKLNWLINQQEKSVAMDLVKEFELEDQVDLVIGRNIKNWESILNRSDVALHLQYSAYDQPAPYLMQSLLSETAVITNRNSYSEFLNDQLVFKISSGINEEPELRELLKNHEFLLNAKVAKQAKDFAETHYAPSMVAADLVSMIEFNQKKVHKFKSDWQSFQRSARKQLFEEMKELYQENLDIAELKASWGTFADNNLAMLTGDLSE